MVIHEKNERELQKNMSSRDLRAEDITGSGSYLGAIYQEEVDEGGKFKKKKKKRTTKKSKGGVVRINLRPRRTTYPIWAITHGFSFRSSTGWFKWILHWKLNSMLFWRW